MKPALTLLISLLLAPLAALRAADALDITVDFAKPLGKIRALNGVNNGPVTYGKHSADIVARHQEAGFSGVRLHDSHWPNPNVVDIPCIFPLFHADADDPRNYIFKPTDHYLAPIFSNGCQIVYRLGTSIEHKTDFHTYPPEDFQKWAKVCVNVIRHYNDGWANGAHQHIRYFEIWNEPEIKAMWRGTPEQFLDLYRVTAAAIKAHDPSLKVGPALAMDCRSPLLPKILDFCREQKVPLDFVSWHIYPTLQVEKVTRAAVSIRELLDQHGFTKAESLCTEWKPLVAPPPLRWRQGEPPGRIRDAFTRNRNHEAAACSASILIAMQDAPVDMAFYYTADTSPWGMFNEFGEPGKVFFAFKAFHELLQTSNRVTVAGAPDVNTLAACAGMADDRQTAGILLSNYRGESVQVRIALENMPVNGAVCAERYLVDEKHEFEPVGDDTLDGQKPWLTVTMPPATVCLVRLKFASSTVPSKHSM